MVTTSEDEHICYFCAIKINNKHVEWWQTVPRNIEPHKLRLHPKCSLMLSERLIKDTFKADTINFLDILNFLDDIKNQILLGRYE